MRSLLIESFNGRLRDELLNEMLFTSFSQARAVLASSRSDYNINRPHSRLGWADPFEFAHTFTPRRDTALRTMISSAPVPVAQTAQQGNIDRPSELRIDKIWGQRHVHSRLPTRPCLGVDGFEFVLRSGWSGMGRRGFGRRRRSTRNAAMSRPTGNPVAFAPVFGTAGENSPRGCSSLSASGVPRSA